MRGSSDEPFPFIEVISKQNEQKSRTRTFKAATLLGLLQFLTRSAFYWRKFCLLKRASLNATESPSGQANPKATNVKYLHQLLNHPASSSSPIDSGGARLISMNWKWEALKGWHLFHLALFVVFPSDCAFTPNAWLSRYRPMTTTMTVTLFAQVASKVAQCNRYTYLL